MPRPAGLAALLTLCAACGHVEPGAPSDPGSIGPFGPGTPTQVTFNPGRDLWPAWSDDGSSIWYVYQDLGRADGDYCLGRIPATGGTRTVSFCQVVPPAANDSLDVAVSPAPRGDRLAWFRIHSRKGDLVPASGELMVGPVADLAAAVPVLRFPFQTPNGAIQSFGQDLQWADDSTLVYAGTAFRVFGNPPTDTILDGAGITLVHLHGTTATHEVLAVASDASSIGVGAGGVLYFARPGLGRIYELHPPDTTITVAYDFGGGTVTDIRSAGARLYAVRDPAGNPIDGGGVMYMFINGVAIPLTSDTAWRHPVPSPDGHAIVASRSTGGLPDLYLLPAP